MKYYFILQLRRIKRKFLAMGISPIWAYLLSFLGFIALSKFLFCSTSYADWIYVLLGISVVFKLGESNRNDLLKSLYKKKDYYRIRVLENSIAVLPFSLYLLYEGRYLMVLILSVFSILLAAINFRQQLNYTIPTPFRKHPFEFIIGFRKYFLFILLAFFLTYKAIEVSNFNLGLFSLAVLFFISMSFYMKPEKVYFVWIYSTSVKIFLRKKVVNALLCSSVLSMPVLIALSIFFSDEIVIIAGGQLLGYVFIISMVLAKYSAFPNEISLPQAILFGLSLWFPPMLLIIIPIFYVQSIKRLRFILE